MGGVSGFLGLLWLRLDQFYHAARLEALDGPNRQHAICTNAASGDDGSLGNSTSQSVGRVQGLQCSTLRKIVPNGTAFQKCLSAYCSGEDE